MNKTLSKQRIYSFLLGSGAAGRMELWKNFDVKPEYHASYSVDLLWVYFALVLSILGVIGVIFIWRLRRRVIK